MSIIDEFIESSSIDTSKAIVLDEPIDRFKPGEGRVVFRRFRRNQSGSIHLIDGKDQRKEWSLARVISVGPPQRDENHRDYLPTKPVVVAPGDIVALRSYSGHDAVFAGIPYVIGTQDDILAVFESEKANEQAVIS